MPILTNHLEANRLTTGLLVSNAQMVMAVSRTIETVAKVCRSLLRNKTATVNTVEIGAINC